LRTSNAARQPAEQEWEIIMAIRLIVQGLSDDASGDNDAVKDLRRVAAEGVQAWSGHTLLPY
jgi:hypothetical protein